MTYRPVLTTGDGAARLDYLRATRELQTKAVAREADVAAEVAYFRARVGSKATPAALLADGRLREFVAKAFGIEDLKADTTLLTRALGESVDRPRALATSHADLRLRETAGVFGYGDAGGAFTTDALATPELTADRATRKAAAIDQVVERYLAVALEAGVKAVDRKLGEALAFDRLAQGVAATPEAEALKWERMLDDPAMAKVLKRSLNLSDGFGAMTEGQRIAAVDAAYRQDFNGDAASLAEARDRRQVAARYLAGGPVASDAAATGPTLGSYQPVLPQSGLAGWTYLQRTLGEQQANFNRTAQMARDVAYFEANIGKATTAEALVKDPTLLRVALGAYGLGAEAPKRAYVQKALAEGTEADDAMANRIVDPKYREMAAAFGFGDAKGAQVDDPDFIRDVVARYRVRQFEEAVGEQDNSLRLALNFDREASRLAGGRGGDAALWFQLLGDTPLRKVMETALGLPASFGKLDVQRQADDMRDRFESRFGGDIRSLSDPAVRQSVIRKFLTLDQIALNAVNPASSAMTVLQNISNSMRAAGGLSLRL